MVDELDQALIEPAVGSFAVATARRAMALTLNEVVRSADHRCPHGALRVNEPVCAACGAKLKQSMIVEHGAIQRYCCWCVNLDCERQGVILTAAGAIVEHLAAKT